jgi:hypothetical protein
VRNSNYRNDDGLINQGGEAYARTREYVRNDVNVYLTSKEERK